MRDEIKAILNPAGGPNRPDPADAALAIEAILGNAPAAEGNIGIAGRRFARTASKRNFENLLRVEAATAQIQRLPDPNETVHLVVSGQYAPFSVIGATLKLAPGEAIDQLWLATLSYSRGNIIELLRLLDGGQVKSTVLVSSVFDRANDKARYEFTERELRKRGQRFVSLRAHAKIVAMALSGGRRLVIESSANLRSCSTIEQFCLTNSPELFNFHVGWMEEALSTNPEGQTP